MGLAQRGAREEEGLSALKALIADVSLEIFRAQEVERLLDLFEKISVDLVLIAKVVIRDEEADFDPCAAYKLLGTVREQQAGGPLETVLFDQLQIAEHDLPAVT